MERKEVKIFYIVRHVYMRNEDNEPVYWYEACDSWANSAWATEFSSKDAAIRSAPVDSSFTVIECYEKPYS